MRKDNEVFNVIPGQTTILSIKPDGSMVKKGEQVCDLDPFALKTKLAAQEVVAKEAETAYQNARAEREVAELAVTEYVEGIYKQQLEALKYQDRTGRGRIRRVEAQREKIKRLIEKGIYPKNRLTASDVAMQRAKLVLEAAQGEKSILEKFTMGKKVKLLQGRVEKARSDELAGQLVTIASCRPGRSSDPDRTLQGGLAADGRLTYSSPIEPGDVDEGQLLFRVVAERK